MAKFVVTPSTELQQMLQLAGDIDAVAPRMLRPAGNILKAAVQKRLASHRRTGGLERSVSLGKPKKHKTGGWYTGLGFNGYDENGTANAIKAAGIEFGNTSQQPAPFIDAAVRDCEADTTEAMQAEYTLYLREKELVE